ncbi:deaminase [Streptomyces sp. NPDC054796]
MTPTDEDHRWMRRAINLAHQCPPSDTAFSVGAVIVDTNGQEMSSGYSREVDAHVHAEESALNKLATDDERLSGATVYSTFEPCSQRKSRPLSCTQLLLRANVRRVMIAWREPDLFVTNCTGVETLEAAGIVVEELPELAEAARAMNGHVLG